MPYMNKAILIGHLTKDVERKQTTSGIDVARISIATNEVWKDKDGNKQEKATFHDVTLWRHSAKFASDYAHKGDLVLVEGKIEKRSWDKDDGSKGYAVEIVADTFEILKSKQLSERDVSAVFDDEEAPRAAPAKKASYPQDDISIDDLPF